MGGAMLRGWLGSCNRHFISRITVSCPNQETLKAFDDTKVPLFWHQPGTPFMTTEEAERELEDLIVCFAVKPKMMKGVLQAWQPYIPIDALVLTVAAGLNLRFYQDLLPNVDVVRVMPNTPVAVNQGVLGLYADPQLPLMQKEKLMALMALLGTPLFVDSDDALDRLTTLSGCGPAYVFLMAELLAKIGQEMGLSKNMSMDLATATIAGSAQYMTESPQDPASLKRQVASPGGMTAEGLGVLENQEVLHTLLKKAIDATYEKAQTLKESLQS